MALKGSAEDSGSDNESNEPYVVPARSTRGKRFSEFNPEEAEADADFWGQKAWEDVSSDDDLDSQEWSSDEKEDIEDSDFDEVDEVTEARERDKEGQEADLAERRLEREETRNKKKRGSYVDPGLFGRTSRKPSAVKREQKPKRAHESTTQSRGLRASTPSQHAQASKSSSLLKAATAEAKRPKIQMTQQQLLEEAARTEIENRRSLDLILLLQEERKRERSKVVKQSMPRVVYFSSQRGVRKDKEGNALHDIQQTLCFKGVSSYPLPLESTPPPIAERSICPISGLPAKHRDPLTGTPYQTLQAFKEIRSKVPEVSNEACKIVDIE